MKRSFLLLLLAVCCLLLSACYTEVDPWPEGDLTSTPTPAPTVTVAPATDVPLTSVPFTSVPVTPHPSQQPVYTSEPLPEDAVDVSPNLNG